MINRSRSAGARLGALAVLFAVPSWVACSGQRTSVGPGEDGGGGDGSVCTPADCAGLPAPTLVKVCPDGTNLIANVCTAVAHGGCAWDFPPCPAGDAGDGGDGAEGGYVCPALGCNPSCGAYGVLKDSHGCDTCQCAPPPEAGPACVAQAGEHCGGNTANPCGCVPGLVCTPGDSGLPFGDVGGTCR